MWVLHLVRAVFVVREVISELRSWMVGSAGFWALRLSRSLVRF